MTEQKCDQNEIGSEVRRKIEKYLQNKQFSGDDPRHAADVKNVVEMKHTLIKNFVQKHLMRARKKCHFCGEVKTNIQVQETARFIFSSSKTASKPNASDNVERSVSQTRTVTIHKDEHSIS